MNKRVTLVYPPQHEPDMPHLAPAVVKAALQHEGVETRVIDANIDFYHHVLSSPAVLSAEAIPGEVARASRVVRSPFTLEELDSYLQARQRVEVALDVGVRPFGAHLALESSSLLYENMHSEQVAAALDDRLRNPYIGFFEERLDDYTEHTDVLGISVGIPEQLIAGLTLAKLAKEHRPDITVMMGGNLYSRIADEIDATVLRTHFDFGVRKVGEIKFLEAIKALRAGAPRQKIDEILVNEQFAVPEMRGAPIPDFSDLDLSLYFSPVRALPVRTGRGCYKKVKGECDYCPIPAMSGTFQSIKANQLLETTLHYFEHYGVTFFKDTLESHVPGVGIRFAEMVKNQGLPFHLETFSTLDPWVLGAVGEKIKGGPHRRMMYGLETTSLETLIRENKRAYFEESSQAVLRRSYELGMSPFTFVIAGLPEETEEETLATAALLRDSPYLAGGHLLLIYHLCRYTKDGDDPEKRAKLGFEDVHLKGDLSVHYAYKINGEDVSERHRSVGRAFQEIVHQNPRMHLLTAMQGAAKMYALGALGRDFADEYIRRYGLPEIVPVLAERSHVRSRIVRVNGP